MLNASVYARLCASNARLLAARDLGEGFGLARWANSRDHVGYENSRCHVLSLYTEDGTRSRRADRACGAGFPGALTLMPQGASSDWEIGGDFSFVHLYIPDAMLRAFAAEVLGCDPAAAQLPERTFCDDPGLAGRLRVLAGLSNPLALRAGLDGLLHHLLTAPGWQGLAPARAAGGLSPAQLRRLRDHIAADPGAAHSLGALAALAGLSAFHFHRAFRASTGLTPHEYVARLRIRHAEALIRAGLPLAQVAADCGFAHNAHLTRAFRAARGVTPSAWRAAAA